MSHRGSFDRGYLARFKVQTGHQAFKPQSPSSPLRRTGFGCGTRSPGQIRSSMAKGSIAYCPLTVLCGVQHTLRWVYPGKLLSITT